MQDKNALVEDILKHADIVAVVSNYINVIKKGRNYWAICPFHDDSNPSLSISPEKGLFKCFSCNTGGNAIGFIQKYEKISYDQAIRKLAELIGYNDPRLNRLGEEKKRDPSLTPLYSCINDLSDYYSYSLNTEEGEKGREYLNSRNIKEDQIKKFSIGYSPNDGANTIRFLQAKGHSLKDIEGIGATQPAIAKDKYAGRVIFPLKDEDGQIVGFSARRINNGDSSKYINSQEGPIFHKGKILYNYHNVKSNGKKDGYCYVLEGFMDVLALDRAGINSAVALMGTSLSEDHIKLLRRLNCEIRVCLDGDAPGQTATMKIIAQLSKANIPYRIVSNPGDLRDPDEILQQEGVETLKKMMNNLVDPYDFQIDFYQNTKKLETQEDKKKVLIHFLPFLRDIKPGVDRDNYVVKLSKVTGYEVETIYSQINKHQTNKTLEEETIFGDMYYQESMNPGNKSLSTRLYKAERALVYYLMQTKLANEFYGKNQGMFYTDINNELANYLYEFRETHDEEKVDVAALIGMIQTEGGENSETYSDALSRIAMDTGWPPCNQNQLEVCKKAISEERELLYEQNLLDKSIVGKDQDDKARLINDYAKSKYDRLKSNKKKK